MGAVAREWNALSRVDYKGGADARRTIGAGNEAGRR
jgi:hypothetical protein